MLIAGFMPESFVDWRGKIVATIFTYGCNFRCPFCHNYTLVTEKPESLMSREEIIEKVENLKEWTDGVCITGGEPMLHEDIVEFIKELSRITQVKLDTNGSFPDRLREALPYVSYVAMDIKAPKERYEELAGAKVDISKIDESIQIIKNKARDYEFRTTAVPVLSKEDFRKIAEWLSEAKRYVIQQYSTQGGTLRREYAKLRPYNIEFLQEICREIKPSFRECLVANL